MDFGIIYQLKSKKYWWMDTILYFVIALLLATVFCFFIFTFKISLEKKELQIIEDKLVNTGTALQKEMEKKVFAYQEKINNFAAVLAAHKIPTNLLTAIEESTLSNVWFNNFSMDTKSAGIIVTGETDDVPSLTRQIEVLETKDIVKGISNLSIELKETGKIRFTFNLAFDPKILFEIKETTEVPPINIEGTTSPSVMAPFNFIF